MCSSRSSFSRASSHEYIQQIILYAFIVIIASLGLNVIYGYTGQFSLGHAAFYGIGAYTSAYLTHLLSVEVGPPLSAHPAREAASSRRSSAISSASPFSGCGMIFWP